MNTIGSNVIKLCCEYMNCDDMDYFRRCSMQLNKIIGPVYFQNMTISPKTINNKNKHLFRVFVHKYKIQLSVIDIKKTSQLKYFISYDVKSISHTLNIRYVQYLLPATLKKLCFPFYHNSQIYEDVLNIGLKHLEFGSSYNKIIDKNVLPSTLEYLRFKSDFDQPIYKNILPNSLKYLELGFGFNNYIDPKALPATLEALIMGNTFDKPIVLPCRLKHLVLGYRFNQSINGILPDGLESILFSSNYTQPIAKGSLPKSLKKIIFKGIFSQSIDILPEQLETFMCNTFDPPLRKNMFPATLKYLSINIDKKINKHVLPTSLNSLELIDGVINNILPPNLENLTLTMNQSLVTKSNKSILPTTLKSLKFGYNFNNKLLNLPSSLTHLEFGAVFNKPLDKCLLNTKIEKIIFCYYSCFNKSLKNLPPTLKYLSLGPTFNRPIHNNTFPETLEELIFGEDFDQQIKKNVLPKNLKRLTFGQEFRFKINKNVLPYKLIYLRFSYGYNYSLEGVLPPFLKTLVVDPKYQWFDMVPPYVKIVKLGNYFY
jgi:hypothetical protein